MPAVSTPPAIRQTQAKSILVRSRLPGVDFAANPYTGCEHACIYCYASSMLRHISHLEPWGGFVDVKSWPAIKNPCRLASKTVFLSSVTDAWQPCEAKFLKTRALLESLVNSGCKLRILTKSDLILRDLDLIKRFPDVRVSWSINALDPETQAKLDKGAPAERRLEAMRRFHEAGVKTGCFIAPAMLGITDVAAIRARCAPFCDEIWRDGLNLRWDNRGRLMNLIRREFPDLMPLYRIL